MTFGQAIRSCFRKFVTFRGRAPRSEYWYFVLFGVLLSVPASIVDVAIATSGGMPPASRPLTGLVALVMFLPRLSVGVRRLHDVNYSGWFLGGYLLYIAAVLGAFVALMINLNGAKPNFGSPLGLIAIAGLLGMMVWGVWLVVLTFLKGTTGPNRFGEDPLGPSADVFS